MPVEGPLSLKRMHLKLSTKAGVGVICAYAGKARVRAHKLAKNFEHPYDRCVFQRLAEEST